jgi:hypothetical protein
MDPRNALPEDGFRFLTKEEAGRGRSTAIHRIDDRLSVARETPPLGLGSAGWLIQTDHGKIAIEAAGYYSPDVLDEIGELDRICATHPHGYGAIWQLQEAFGTDISVHRNDLLHTKAFRVTRPLDDEGELVPSIRYKHLGGHYDGQCAFFDEEASRLFAGDAIKVDYNENGEPTGLSAHKGFHYEIPLTTDEIGYMRRALADIPFNHVATTFDHAASLGRDTVLAFFDWLSRSEPTTKPIEIEKL